MPRESRGDQKPNLYLVCTQIGELKGAVAQISLQLNTTLASHEKRINDVEERAAQMTGKLSVAAAIFGLIGGAVLNAFTSFIKK